MEQKMYLVTVEGMKRIQVEVLASSPEGAKQNIQDQMAVNGTECFEFDDMWDSIALTAAVEKPAQ